MRPKAALVLYHLPTYIASSVLILPCRLTCLEVAVLINPVLSNQRQSLGFPVVSNLYYPTCSQRNFLPEWYKLFIQMALDAASPLPTAKDANFFYPDGTIILAVGCGREDASLFCIYKTQLAQQRDVFRDMLSLPQPAVTPRGIPADAENMEGVEDRPVLQMDDEVKDVRTTFTLLWDIP